jgi:hypothetical protein
MQKQFTENLLGRNLKNEHEYTYTIISVWLEDDTKNANFGKRVCVLGVGNAGKFYGETIKVSLPDPYWKITT